jgi:membrane protein
MVIKGYRVGPLLKATGREILDDGILGLAAQTAYYFFFSLFPLILFAAPFTSFVGEKHEVVNWLMTQLAGAVPAEAMTLLRGVIAEVVFAEGAPGIMSVGALLAAWAGSNVFGSLIDALNRAYDVTEGRPWWKQKLISLASVVAAGVLLAIVAAVIIGGTVIAEWLSKREPNGAVYELLWNILRYPIAFAFFVAMLWLIYYFLPNLRQHKKQILVGAVAAAALWIVVALLFQLYVLNFGSYNKTYGAIGGVIILLTWMYLTMLVILAGGELNAELHHGTGAIEPRKGAVYAGRVITAREPGKTSTESVDRLRPLPHRGA